MGDHKHKKSSKKDHKDSSSREHKRHKKSSSSHKKEKEIDYSDPSLWVEAGTNSEITPAEHLRNQQRATESIDHDTQPNSLPQEEEARHGWMLDGGMDFGAMGVARVKEEDKPKPNPDFVSFFLFSLNYTNLFNYFFFMTGSLK